MKILILLILILSTLPSVYSFFQTQAVRKSINNTFLIFEHKIKDNKAEK